MMAPANCSSTPHRLLRLTVGAISRQEQVVFFWLLLRAHNDGAIKVRTQAATYTARFLHNAKGVSRR